MTAELLIPGALPWIKKKACCFSTAALIGYWHSVETGLSFATPAQSQDWTQVVAFSAPMDATTLGFEARARLWRFQCYSMRRGSISCRRESFRFLAALPLVTMGGYF